MMDYRTVGILLIGIVAYGGCCVAVVRAFFMSRHDGVALPSAIWWLGGAAALSAGVSLRGVENATLVYAIAVLAVLLAGQAFGSLWWRGKAMQSEMDTLRKASVEHSMESDDPAGERCCVSIRNFDVACATAARTYDLTRREEDVLRLLMEGCNVSEAAEKLFVSPNTVKSHVRRIYRKMGVNRRSGIKERLEEACRS
ncbi:MAG: helix-turn-helix transcriptional regulator [Eggerthellaceae bacterium]|nr:helix-turn-helix transcriptional regulator [Eggerthellaceae bacterium]